jgi:hypothetical protein
MGIISGACSCGSANKDVNLHNADGTTGRKLESDSATVNLSSEDNALLSSIADALGTGGTANDFNVYASNSAVVPNVVTVIASKSVASLATAKIQEIVVWGDIDADWTIEVGGTPVGGARTSPSRLTETVTFQRPIVVAGPVTITLKAEHYGPSNAKLSANLIGEEPV